jgi:hypothetical protein
MRKQYLATVMGVALVGGFLGGALVARLPGGRNAVAAESAVETHTEVKARKFALLDAQEKVRAVLEMAPMDGLGFRGDNSFLSDRVPALILFDERGDLLYRLTVSDNRERAPGLLIEGRDGKVQASLVLEGDGRPGITVQDKDGNALWSSTPPPAQQ